MLILGRSEVAALLPMNECIDVMAQAMEATARGQALQPLRSIMKLPGDAPGFFGLMPGALEQPSCFGIKVVSVFPENSARNLPSHQGAVLLFDSDTGTPLAMLDGGEVTAIRTAAASGLATRVLAREDAGDLAILGNGEQAGTHLDAMNVVRDLRRVRVWGRSPERAQGFASRMAELHDLDVEVVATAEDAVRDADLICTTTAARKPVLLGQWIAPGAHLNVVGSSQAFAREVDTEAVVRARLFVDLKLSTMNEAGEFLIAREEGAIDEDHIQGEIGQVLIGEKEGRRSPDEITLYKSLGIVVEDLATAHYVYGKAKERGVGIEVDT